MRCYPDYCHYFAMIPLCTGKHNDDEPITEILKKYVGNTWPGRQVQVTWKIDRCSSIGAPQVHTWQSWHTIAHTHGGRLWLENGDGSSNSRESPPPPSNWHGGCGGWGGQEQWRGSLQCLGSVVLAPLVSLLWVHALSQQVHPNDTGRRRNFAWHLPDVIDTCVWLRSSSDGKERQCEQEAK